MRSQRRPARFLLCTTESWMRRALVQFPNDPITRIIHYWVRRGPAWTRAGPVRQDASVRTLPHIKKLDDAVGQFRVRITCCGGAARECEPEALARICGSSATLESKEPPPERAASEIRPDCCSLQ